MPSSCESGSPVRMSLTTAFKDYNSEANILQLQFSLLQSFKTNITLIIRHKLNLLDTLTGSVR